MFLGLILLIALGAYFLFFYKGNTKVQLHNSKSADETLRERFVNGEIDEDTFRKMKETIKH